MYAKQPKKLMIINILDILRRSRIRNTGSVKKKLPKF